MLHLQFPIRHTFKMIIFFLQNINPLQRSQSTVTNLSFLYILIVVRSLLHFSYITLTFLIFGMYSDGSTFLHGNAKTWFEGRNVLGGHGARCR